MSKAGLVKRLPTDIEGLVHGLIEELHEPMKNEPRWEIARRYLAQAFNLGAEWQKFQGSGPRLNPNFRGIGDRLLEKPFVPRTRRIAKGRKKK